MVAQAYWEGDSNSFFGMQAGEDTGIGSNNSFFGQRAGRYNTEGSQNSFFGTRAGEFSTTGESNSFFGYLAGGSSETTCCNSFFGRTAGLSTTGPYNSFFGDQAGESTTTGTANSFFGDRAGQSNGGGGNNAFFGQGAGISNTEGCCNSFLGTGAGLNNTTGVQNLFAGGNSGWSNTTESGNTFLGYGADGVAGVRGSTALGNLAKVTRSNSLVLGAIDGVGGADANANVGIGTTAPQTPLHVRRSDGTARVLVQETSASTARRVLLDLRSAGGAFARFWSTAPEPDATWLAGSDGVGDFVINANNGTPNDLRLTQSGDLSISGSLSQGSARSSKRAIGPAQPKRLLAKLDELPIYTWAYRSDPNARHVGPMAGAFARTYGFGSDRRTISPGDVGGVALAAIKRLARENRDLRTKLRAQDRRIVALERSG